MKRVQMFLLPASLLLLATIDARANDPIPLSPPQDPQGEVAAAPRRPVLIIRDMGGVAGPNLGFIVFADLNWQYTAMKATGRVSKAGKIDAKALDAMMDGLKKVGLEKAKTIRPSPAPHSQIFFLQGTKLVNITLARDNELMKIARKLVVKQVR